MGMKFWKRIVLAIGIFLGALVVFFAVTARVYTQPFKDTRGNIIPGSIAMTEKHEIDGVSQMLWFRGLNVDNPVLIFV
jgi:hypothetical protein